LACQHRSFPKFVGEGRTGTLLWMTHLNVIHM
jgi:hypothetical protein